MIHTTLSASQDIAYALARLGVDVPVATLAGWAAAAVPDAVADSVKPPFAWHRDVE